MKKKKKRVLNYPKNAGLKHPDDE